MKKNIINIEEVSYRSDVDYYCDTLDKYNEKTNAIFTDFENNRILVKKGDASASCWVHFTYDIDLYPLDEMYLEFELKTKTAYTGVVFDIESTAYNFMIEVPEDYRTGEWVKYRRKIMLNSKESGGQFSIGNTFNRGGEFEIRNIILEHNSKNPSSRNDVVIPALHTGNSGTRESVYQIAKFSKGEAETLWTSLNLFLTAEANTVLYTISFFNKTLKISTSILNGTSYSNHLKFYRLNNSDGSVEIYIELLRTCDGLSYLGKGLSKKKKFSITKVNEMPAGSVHIIDTKYVMTGVSTFTTLDTPYYTTKMQQEGIYEDFITYMDEQHEYERQQRELEEQRQLEFDNIENKEQSYEDWLSTQPQLMPFAEPQPSQDLLDFKKKYLG